MHPLPVRQPALSKIYICGRTTWFGLNPKACNFLTFLSSCAGSRTTMSRPVSYFYLCCLFFFLSQPSVVLSIPASGHIASAYNASISTLERRFEQDAIICAPGPIPTEAWPASLGRSPKEYQTLWDVCSAYGNTGANAGCLCEQPGLNYDVDCYKNLVVQPNTL